jgi:predicted TIM-barrel fold metal-dependent hydrolase
MLQGYSVYDADAHVVTSQRAWEDLPEALRARRPRPVQIQDPDGLGGYRISWYSDGQVVPHPFGPGSQPANTPRGSLDLELFPGIAQMDSRVTALPFEGQDLSDPVQRLRLLDAIGIDVSVVYPSTIYATFTTDPQLEAGLYRAYNRYVGSACRADPRRLKWAGLLPLRHPQEACAAIAEMRELGARAAVVFGTAGEQLLSDRAFDPVFAELTRARLPLSIHFGASYPPLWQISRTMFAGNILSMTTPVFLAFYAVTAGGLLDRYPDLKVAFLEFGSEWILYMVPRMEQYLRQAVENGWPYAADIPEKRILEYARSGNIFVACEAEDSLIREEMKVLGEDQILFSSDIPHSEMRESGAEEIVQRDDLSPALKQKILWDNPVRFYGEP